MVDAPLSAPMEGVEAAEAGRKSPALLRVGYGLAALLYAGLLAYFAFRLFGSTLAPIAAFLSPEMGQVSAFMLLGFMGFGMLLLLIPAPFVWRALTFSARAAAGRIPDSHKSPEALTFRKMPEMGPWRLCAALLAVWPFIAWYAGIHRLLDIDHIIISNYGEKADAAAGFVGLLGVIWAYQRSYAEMGRRTAVEKWRHERNTTT